MTRGNVLALRSRRPLGVVRGPVAGLGSGPSASSASPRVDGERRAELGLASPLSASPTFSTGWSDDASIASP